jgi:hypothetical protein
MLKVALLVVVIFNALLPWSVADKSVALELPSKNLSLVATKKKVYSLSRFSLGGVAVERWGIRSLGLEKSITE